MAELRNYHHRILEWRRRAMDLLDLPVSYKDTIHRLRGPLPRDAVMKLRPACLAVKGGGGRAACTADCESRRDTWVHESGDPFVFTCHAGLREYRAPVLHAGELLGLWSIGPIRGERQQRPTTIPAAVWDQLPSAFPPHTATVAAMLADYTATLAEERRQVDQVGGVRHPSIRRALELILAEPSAATTAKAMAARVGLSPVQFSVAFKQATGQTFSSFLDERVMAAARYHLQDADVPLRAVAEKLGYATHSYFTRAFKRFHGETPSQYRARLFEPDEV